MKKKGEVKKAKKVKNYSFQNSKRLPIEKMTEVNDNTFLCQKCENKIYRQAARDSRPRTCESCIEYQETCSRVIIDNPCFHYREADV